MTSRVREQPENARICVNSPLLVPPWGYLPSARYWRDFKSHVLAIGLVLCLSSPVTKLPSVVLHGSVVCCLWLFLKAQKSCDFQSAPSVLPVSHVYLNFKAGTQNSVIIQKTKQNNHRTNKKHSSSWISPFPRFLLLIFCHRWWDFRLNWFTLPTERCYLGAACFP